LIYFDAFGRGKSDTGKRGERIYTLGKGHRRHRRPAKSHAPQPHKLCWDILTAAWWPRATPLNTDKTSDHLIIATAFTVSSCGRKTTTTSNHEIKTNYPEVWDTLMRIREQGAISSDQLHQNIYGRVPYGFYMPTTPKILSAVAASPTRILSTRNYTTRWWARMATLIVGNDIGKFLISGNN